MAKLTKYFVERSGKPKEGPYTLDELRELFGDGQIGTETLVRCSETETVYSYSRLMSDEGNRTFVDIIRASTAEDLAEPVESLGRALWPFDAFRALSQTDHNRVLIVTTIGLFPIFAYLFLGDVLDARAVFVLTAAYFSILWAVFFYNIFPARGVRVSTSVFCFIGTTAISISMLMLLYQIPGMGKLLFWAQSDDLSLRLVGFLFGVGLPEELCKLVMVYVLSRRADEYSPRIMLYYGLMCGLGFGIYEGVSYQLERNFLLASTPGEYLFLNLLRLTTTPMLHAMWTGIAAFLFAFAVHFPKRKVAFGIACVGIPALMHGGYDAFSGTLGGLSFAALSVLMLSLYLAKHDRIVSWLRYDSRS